MHPNTLYYWHLCMMMIINSFYKEIIKGCKGKELKNATISYPLPIIIVLFNWLICIDQTITSYPFIIFFDYVDPKNIWLCSKSFSFNIIDIDICDFFWWLKAIVDKVKMISFSWLKADMPSLHSSIMIGGTTVYLVWMFWCNYHLFRFLGFIVLYIEA